MSVVLQVDAKPLEKYKIGVVCSRFNEPITGPLMEGALSELKSLGFNDSQIVAVSIPGALELPFAAQELMKAGCDGVVLLGCVIRGETTHYDFVCDGVVQGGMNLQMSTGKPVSFGVLTTENRQQAEARSGGAKGHKGKEAVQVLIEMLNLKSKLNS